MAYEAVVGLQFDTESGSWQLWLDRGRREGPAERFSTDQALAMIQAGEIILKDVVDVRAGGIGFVLSQKQVVAALEGFPRDVESALARAKDEVRTWLMATSWQS